jgi:ATP-binding cassette, subfamily B, vacuolar membrane transporter HMT1/ACLQ
MFRPKHTMMVMLNLKQSAILAVDLFYLAGLLPDPDIPYTTNEWNIHIWCISLLFEILQLALFAARVRTPFLSPPIDATQVAMAALRVVLLLAMISISWFTGPKIETDTTTSPAEAESLLRNGEPVPPQSISYGAVSKKFQAVKITQVNDAQQTTWLDYVVGFRKLFPYLW